MTDTNVVPLFKSPMGTQETPTVTLIPGSLDWSKIIFTYFYRAAVTDQAAILKALSFIGDERLLELPRYLAGEVLQMVNTPREQYTKPVDERFGDHLRDDPVITAWVTGLIVDVCLYLKRSQEMAEDLVAGLEIDQIYTFYMAYTDICVELIRRASNE